MSREPKTRNHENAPKARVFVYGTLRRGGSNNFRMDGCKWLGPAGVNAHLYEVDWYPGLVLDEDAAEVVGDLYEVPNEKMPELDKFEGSEYRRVRAMVQTAEDTAMSAWIWEWNRSTEGLEPIPDGDWLTVDPGVTIEKITDED